jgi:hypothetical protein
MNKKLISSGVLAITLATAISIVKEAKTLNYESTTYSTCTNPGQFWGDFGIDKDKYENIYLGYCSVRGVDGDVIINKKHKKNSPPVVKSIPTPEIVIVETPKPTKTEIPNSTETPDSPKEKECKNKNSGKDGTPSECNAGIGQEKHDN